MPLADSLLKLVMMAMTTPSQHQVLLLLPPPPQQPNHLLNQHLQPMIPY
jgi:hypothetical protein